MNLKERWAKALKKLTPAPKPVGSFVPDAWAKELMNKLHQNILLSGMNMMEPIKEEPICPITRQLILQQLGDIAAKYPNSSILDVVNAALQNGVSNDYDFADRLERVLKGEIKLGNVFGRTIVDEAVDHLRKSIDNHALDALRYGQAGMKISIKPPKRGQLVGSSDPADTTGSCGG